ncbi:MULTISPECIES: acyl carrier protein [Bacteroides]|jgi:acyl carrier protein|uniref:acyl carrier protein n=1 Tax=Bacteroides TaxID=816 RepID=UPI00164C913A|nr:MULTISPECIES: acyl carrier protein [Bacteroides]MBC5613136.1 acyl carrier protein [Bacteroides hominis (ex Liu et al. 2022)]MCM0249254.1 acyl carrier protein [Bacteroides fragilis]MCM0333594.1 acyl carrier protein [Bacteroides fragilis]MCS2830097.1 acyl carrier protein [Bacteroides fragilis]
MDREIIMEKIQDIFRDVFDDEELIVADSTSSDDIEEWDSLSHIQLVVAVEKAFGLKLTSKEILSWEDVGEMADAIHAKLA